MANKLFYALLLASGFNAAYAEETARQVNVSSDEVEYSVDGKNAAFRGNVEVTAGGLHLQAETLLVEQQETGNQYTAQPGDQPLSLFCDDCAEFTIRAEIKEQAVYHDERGQLLLSGGIFVCADQDCRRGRLNAARGEWMRDSSQLRLYGAPAVTGYWQPDDTPEPLQIEAQEAVYFFNSSEAVLSGAARVTRGKNTISGTVIRINAKTGALSAQSDQKQRVQATFEQ